MPNIGLIKLMDHEEGELLSCVNQQGGGYELQVGMKVNSEAEAFQLCNSYAFHKGFSLRIGNKRVDVAGKLRERYYLCSKAGLKLDDDLNETKKWHKLDTRTDCKARIKFSVKDGEWEIKQLNLSHYHEFARPGERQFLRSARKIPNAHAGVLSSMVDVGIRPVKSYSYMSQEVGGPENVGFTKKDCQNFLYRLKGKLLEGGDGQSLVNHFKQKQIDDPNFFSSVQVDHLNRMTNFFWRDGQSKLDYECFGDVITFDTTFRTNKYNLICAPFVGVNHHWKNVLFGCAFLLDETTQSFAWVFDTFLKSMGNRKPKTIFTDEDKAMANAIEIVLPEARHRLCTWHIGKKAAQHLADYYGDHEFKKQFSKCFHNCHSELEFEVEWAKLIQHHHSLESHWWLKKLYSIRDKWCPAFSLDTFSADIKSTQRSESTNNIFHQFSTKTMDLVTFVHHYEAKTVEMRYEELQEDFRCKNGDPHLEVRSEMLSHAAEVYTIKLFSNFQKEFIGCMGVRIKHVGSDHLCNSYEANEERHKTVYIVNFNSIDCTVCCTCKKFESMGLLCKHALKVLDLNNVTCIPAHYIMKRWTKRAKQGIELSNLGESSEKSGKSAQALRLSELMHEAINVFNIGSITEIATKVVKRKLVELKEMLETENEIMSIMGISDKVGNKLLEKSIDEPPVLNPPLVRAKGKTNARIKNKMDKKQRKKGSQVCKTNAGHHNEAIQNHTISHPLFHQQSVLQGPTFFNQNYSPFFTFGNSNSSFTNLLQGHDPMSYLSQDSDFCASGQLQQQGLKQSYGQLPSSPKH